MHWTALCKLAMFWVVMELCEDLTVRAPKYPSIISTIRLAENDDLWNVKVFCKLAIFWVVIG